MNERGWKSPHSNSCGSSKHPVGHQLQIFCIVHAEAILGTPNSLFLAIFLGVYETLKEGFENVERRGKLLFA